jgi:predicted metalloprotease with PDZ domain
VGGEAQIDALRRLVHQAQLLFGARHFAHYDFLTVLGASFPGPGGIEHLESSENVLPPDFFTHPDAQLVNADLLAHEFAHSWNGRFRQPADLWTANLNVPMRGSLLWVYEGQTQFWGRVLAARAGQRTLQESLDQLAIDAADTQGRSGRAWKSLQDSSSDSLYMAGHGVTWRDWTRREDYYIEGPLLWLDVDARLRELSGGRRSLDDFARDFLGGRDGDMVTRIYTFEDLCDALDGVAHADWAAFLRARLDAHDGQLATQGLARSGWRLFSMGVDLNKDGEVTSVVWGSAAWRAGLVVGAKVLSVDGQPYQASEIKSAISASRADRPIELRVARGQTEYSLSLTWEGGLRYPHLERAPGTPDLLDDILQPKS